MTRDETLTDRRMDGHVEEQMINRPHEINWAAYGKLRRRSCQSSGDRHESGSAAVSARAVDSSQGRPWNNR
jgi:hypothetical protein